MKVFLILTVLLAPFLNSYALAVQGETRFENRITKNKVFKSNSKCKVKMNGYYNNSKNRLEMSVNYSFKNIYDQEYEKFQKKSPSSAWFFADWKEDTSFTPVPFFKEDYTTISSNNKKLIMKKNEKLEDFLRRANFKKKSVLEACVDHRSSHRVL